MEKLLQIEEYLEANKETFESQLIELLKIPSVSADSSFKTSMLEAANWIMHCFEAMKIPAELIPTEGHPIVLAEYHRDDSLPTVLVYGHYDVQPADPLDLWISKPFEPTVRDGNLYARGATDDKGQMFTHLASSQAWMNTVGELPCNIKYLIEGEEEIGSAHLEDFIEAHRERLKADVVVISDTCQLGPDQPAITVGLRGISYFEIFLQGPKQDLHSGSFGGAVTNPVNTLTQLLSSIINKEGQVQIPGFYDAVESLTEEEREQFSGLPFDEENFKEQVGVDGLSGEKGFTTNERRWARPSFDINGVTGGYAGEGAKTVLPAKANAKFSFRLVPKQDPKQIAIDLEKYLRDQLPPGIKMEFKAMHGSPGVVVPQTNPYLQAAVTAIEQGFGKTPYFIREGGSIPVVTTFYESLGLNTLLLGWGLNDDNTHSPNEKFHLADFHRGIRSSAYLWQAIREI
ncbi:Acetylornithine deacetylase/Succinyl-diaminopimelate desuccinylase [Planctomycetales bacterium 10988]|nr:Acetylornithine deacetylase/Succinyl-diaminopimelate desuccinylase [Planctomycetales bacterium 10988]